MSFLDVLKASLREILAPEFRALLLRTLLLAFALLLVIGGLLAWAFQAFVLNGAPVLALAEAYPWARGLILFLGGVGFLAVMFAITLPILRFVAGRFAGEIAEIVEKHQEATLPARANAEESPLDTARFAVRTWMFNLALLPIAIIPVIGPIILFGVNGYLVGREYYAMASNRYRDPPETEARRKRRRLVVWGGGVVIAVLSSIPLANLLAPSFGVALMLHLDRRYMGEG